MSAVSILEDIEDRAQHDAIMHGAMPVTATWFEERKKRQAERVAAQATIRSKQAKAKTEAEAERRERWTREYVEGQVLWRQETKDVIPLRNKHA